MMMMGDRCNQGTCDTSEKNELLSLEALLYCFVWALWHQWPIKITYTITSGGNQII